MNELVLSTNWQNKSTRKNTAYQALQEFDFDTLADLLVTRLEEEDVEVSHHTKRIYKRALTLWLEYLRPDPEASPVTMIHQADDDDVKRWLAWLKTDKSLSSASRGVYLNGLRMVYKSLVWAQAATYNPADMVKKPKDRKSRAAAPKVVSDSVFEKLLSELESLSQKKARSKEAKLEQAFALQMICLIRLLHDGAMRVSTAVRVKVKDIALGETDGMIAGLSSTDFAPHALARNVKAKRDYTVTLSGPLHRAIWAWLGVRDAYAKKGEEALIINLKARDKRLGTSMGEQNARKYLQRAYDLAGLSKHYKAAHIFRHTGITKVVTRTGNLEAGAKLADHSTVDITRQYTHGTPAQMREVLEVFET